MSSETRELLEICEQLPQAQRAQVANYARSLLPAGGGEKHADASLTRLEALSALQASLGLTPEAARKWIDDAASQRKAWERAG